MTKGEAEELIIRAVMSDKDVAIEMTKGECNVFRVMAGRIIKDMERSNRSLWMKAREYGIEWKDPYTVIRRVNTDRFKLFSIEEGGMLIPLVETSVVEETSKIDKPEEKGV